MESSVSGIVSNLAQSAVSPNMLWRRLLSDVPLRLIRPGRLDRPEPLAVRRAYRKVVYEDEVTNPATGRLAGLH